MRHWVSSHEVVRGGRSGLGYLESVRFPQRVGRASLQETSWPTRANVTVPGVRIAENWDPPPEQPNAQCPICFQPVWFFRNKRGGCAYFDAVGKPWPLHPCMEHPRSAKDYRASMEAPFAYERALRARPRGAAGHGTSSSATADGKPFTTAAPAKQSSADEPLSWWVVLSGLWALLLSFPLNQWLDARLDGIPALLSLWAISLPTLCMALAIGWYLLRVPRPRGDAGDVLASVALAPLLLLFGIVGNVLTCGLGALAAALWVASEANDARRRGNLGGGY